MICPNCGNIEWTYPILVINAGDKALCTKCAFSGSITLFKPTGNPMTYIPPPYADKEDKVSFAPTHNPYINPPFGNIGEKDAEVLAQGGTQFETGAVRSSDKANVRYDLISPIGMRRLAETMEEGRQKYGYFNWERGMPIGDILNHSIAHIYAYLEGKPTGEDDLAHAAWNLFAAMHMEETHPNLIHQVRQAVQDNILGKHEIPKDNLDKDGAVKL